jgi:hypothetical protein
MLDFVIKKPGKFRISDKVPEGGKSGSRLALWQPGIIFLTRLPPKQHGKTTTTAER